MPTCIAAGDADADCAAELRRLLASAGVTVDAHVAARAGQIVVVVLSAAGLADPAFAAQLELVDRFCLPAVRCIPVARGAFDDSAVPPDLASLNWILWNERDPQSAADHVVIASTGDPATYAEHRTLSAEAQTWEAAGQPDELLLDDRRRARAATAQLKRSGRDSLARTTPELEAFVAASTALVRKNLRSRLWNWPLRCVLAGLIVAFMVQVIRSYVDDLETNRISYSLDLTINPDYPDRVAEIAASVLVQGFEAVRPTARATLYDVLARPWGEGVLGLNYDSPLIDVVPVPRRDTLFSADATGSVTRWRRSTGFALERRQLSRRRLETIDVSQDGRLLAVGSFEGLWLVTTSPWKSRFVDLDAKVSGVTLAPAGGAVIAKTTRGLAVVDFDSGAVLRRGGRTDTVLDVQRLAGGSARALIRRGGGPELQIVEPISGRQLAARRVAAWTFETAALGPDGKAVVRRGADRQLHWAPRNLRFKPTGLAVTERSDVIELLPRGFVAYGGREFGVHVAELRTGLVVGTICENLIAIEGVRSVAGEAAVTCTNANLATISNPTELMPTAAPGSGVVRHTAPQIDTDLYSVQAQDDGRLELDWREPGASFRAGVRSSDRWLVAAIHPGKFVHLAAGSDHGHVVAFDVVKDKKANAMKLVEVARWRSPDGSAVRALGWDPADDGRLYARTDSGRWWAVRACVLCAQDGRLVELVRRRLGMCETSGALDGISDAARKLVQLKTCPPPLKPVQG